uniref:Uncharacterized protein n=1 Tax=Ciona savignyi TaxID=51511 RepID=H2ZPY7_CIOSA
MARKKRALNAEESDEFVTPRTLIEQVLQPGENEKTVRRQRRKTRESSKVTSSPVRGSTGILALETVKAATAVKAIANTSLVTPRTALQNVLETQDVIKTVMPATRQRKIVSQSAEPSSDNIADQNEVEQMIDNEIEKVTRESYLKNSKQVELGSSALDEYRQNLHEKLAKFKQPIGHSRLISSTI